jgi:hypothetical protein
MAKVQHYRGLNTNLDRLYDNIKQELQDQKDIEIVSEYKGSIILFLCEVLWQLINLQRYGQDLCVRFMYLLQVIHMTMPSK